MFWEEKENNVLLRIRLTPNAAVQGFKGSFTDADGAIYLKATVISVPEKGKANKELVALLAKTLGLPKSAIEVVTGETSHYKKVLLHGNKQNIIAALTALEQGEN